MERIVQSGVRCAARNLEKTQKRKAEMNKMMLQWKPELIGKMLDL